MIKEFSNQSDSAIFAISTNNGGAQSIDISNVPDWARVTTSTTQITVEVDENLSDIKRSFDILVSNDCGLTVTLTIVQKGKPAAEITCCIISDLSFTYPNAVDYSGGTATPQISYSITAYNSDGEEVEDTSSLTPIFLFSSKEGDGTFYMNDGTVEFGENTSFTVNPSREVELSVWIDGYKDSCEGSIATATATCMQNLAVAVVTCYTMTINSFTMNPSDISANGGESEPEIDYTVYELRNDGSKVRTEDTVDVSFNYDVTDGSGVFENGKIKFSESSSLKTDTHQINVTGRIDNYECGGIATSTTDVTQSGECYLTISPKSLTVIPSGGNAYLKVSSSSNFSVENLPSYASVVSQTDKLITFKFEANTTDEERSGTIKVVNECGEEETMAFKQPEPSITCYKIIAKSLTYNDVEVSGGTSTPHLVYEVYARTINKDTLIEKPSFMTVSMEKVSGEDSTIDRHGNVSYNKNETYEEKETIVKATIGTMGKDFPICKDDSVLSITGSCKQEAAVECILNVSNNNITVTSSITSTSFTVTSSTKDFKILNADEWITATKDGNTVNLTFSTNTGDTRRGSIEVANDCKDNTVVLVQEGGTSECTLRIEPSLINAKANDTQASVTVISSDPNIDITLPEDTFIETVDTSGNQLIFKFDENEKSESRSNLIEIKNECTSNTITITQKGNSEPPISTCYEITELSFNYGNTNFASTGEERSALVSYKIFERPSNVEVTSQITPTFAYSTDAPNDIIVLSFSNGLLHFNKNTTTNERQYNININASIENMCEESLTTASTIVKQDSAPAPTITEIKMGFGNVPSSWRGVFLTEISLTPGQTNKYFVIARDSNDNVIDITQDAIIDRDQTKCVFNGDTHIVSASTLSPTKEYTFNVRAKYDGLTSNECSITLKPKPTPSHYYLQINNEYGKKLKVTGRVGSVDVNFTTSEAGEQTKIEVSNGVWYLGWETIEGVQIGNTSGSAAEEGNLLYITIYRSGEALYEWMDDNELILPLP